MLVLSRRVGESIVIGENIVLTVLDIKGENVRLGTTCPREIPVDRQEVHEKKQRQKGGAA